MGGVSEQKVDTFWVSKILSLRFFLNLPDLMKRKNHGGPGGNVLGKSAENMPSSMLPVLSLFDNIGEQCAARQRDSRSN